MRNVKIITDSCSDLGKDIRTKYGIEYVKMRTVYKGEEKDASLDWETYSPKELYDIMRNKERVLTTQVPVEEFNKAFNECVEKGFDVVYVGCASHLSGSVNTGAVVAKKIMISHPEATIVVIDSLNASLGEGSLAVKAAELRDQGKSAKEIEEAILPIRNTVRQYVALQTLTCLKMAGRVKGSAAFFGNLFGVKPIIISNKDGDNIAVKKVKGRANSLTEIVNMLKETIIDPENQTIYLVHADCEEEAKTLKEQLMSTFHCKDVYMNVMGPIIGASCGPDTIGIFAFGKNVEDDATITA